ncbi:MAG: NAD-dependent epimerase/dehydratase family protein [Clostridiales bacterium]|nr:NAD-dependent epimerase/dehydratase family protein [Clostridiales bacterium]
MVLLTGATGLLGGNLIRILSGRDERARVLVLTNDPAIASLPDNIEVITGDLLDNGALDRFFAVAEDAPVYCNSCCRHRNDGPQTQPDGACGQRGWHACHR